MFRLRLGIVLFWLPLAAQPPAVDFFTFEELEKLSAEKPTEGPLKEKLDRVLNTPVVYGAATQPRHAETKEYGTSLRVAMWNVERGTNYDFVKLAFDNPKGFMAAVNKLWILAPEKLQEIEADAQALSRSDVLVLNEVDLGMTRTDYREVAADLARDLGMHAVFGVEFIEVDPLYLGKEEWHAPVIADDARFLAEQRVDKEKYKGLHGSAILSRLPLRNPKILRFTPCYDWFATEKAAISELEKGKRLAADKVFLERVGREVRQGGRIAIIAEIETKYSPTGFVTVVNAHLENKCLPACRQKQMDELLAAIAGVKNPLVLAGDFNSTGSDGAPMSIRRELMKRVRNPQFWAQQSIKWFTPLSLPNTFLAPTNYFKNYNDPTAKSLPLVAANPEAGLFTKLRGFKFEDGAGFDFGGDKERSVEGREGTLSNSNERAKKGFTTTFHFQRDFKGAVGRMRLDWILVKPHYREESKAEGGSHAWRPHFGRTLGNLNNAIDGQISDHHPIIVDLPLAEPLP